MLQHTNRQQEFRVKCASDLILLLELRIDKSFIFKNVLHLPLCVCIKGIDLYSHTYAGGHFPQQVVGSPGQHAPIVTSRGVLPHPSQGTLSLISGAR